MSKQKSSKQNIVILQKTNTIQLRVKKWLLAGILLIACMSGVLWKVNNQPTKEHLVVSTQIDSEPKVVLPSTQTETFDELLQRLRKTYPITAIRNELEALCQDIEKGKIKLVLHKKPLYHEDHTSAWAYLDSDGFPALGVSLSAIKKMKEEDKELPLLVEDQLIAILLHERFHIVKQGLKPLKEMTVRAVIEGERECWWYTVKELYLPMLHAGRLNGYLSAGTAGTALKAYYEAKGDITSTAWTRFSIQSTGAPKEILKKHGIEIP